MSSTPQLKPQKVFIHHPSTPTLFIIRKFPQLEPLTLTTVVPITSNKELLENLSQLQNINKKTRTMPEEYEGFSDSMETISFSFENKIALDDDCYLPVFNNPKKID